MKEKLKSILKDVLWVLRYIFYSISLKILALCISFKHFNDVHIGDSIISVKDNIEYTIMGKRLSDKQYSNSDNYYYVINQYDLISDGKREQYYLRRNEFVKRMNLHTIINSLFYEYRWYKGYKYEDDITDLMKRKG